MHNLEQSMNVLLTKLMISLPDDGNIDAPYSIDVYEDWVYGTTYSTNKVFRVNKFGIVNFPKDEYRVIVPQGLTHARGILVVQEMKQQTPGKCKWLIYCTCRTGSRRHYEIGSVCGVCGCVWLKLLTLQ